ncbi:capsule assembly Wzi family protein [Spirosoma rigui]|uniref:capsule assembly Wzi family protein n=1 Tax=Spirosoma rigui TaxID=564064 RepID=UPI0009AFC7EA|nr:capsule assembly Wzi family protein [Spirosoma rigui]
MRFFPVWALCLFFISGSWLPAAAQRINPYHLEVGTMGSSDQTPFWLRANQYGTVPLQAPAIRLNAGIYADYRKVDSTNARRFADWGYGVNVIGNGGATSQLLLPEAYVKGRLGAFEVYAGRRRELVGLVDTLLTTGAYAWSGNALPIPKVQIGLPVFTPIPFTKGVLSVMGAFAHGWFENSDRLIKGSYLHQKYVYGRLGKPTWPFRLYAGFNHNVIWAGSAAPGVLNPAVAVNGQLPSSLRYYPAVILGTRGTSQDQVVTSFEDNRIGNHLGSIDIAADVTIGSWNAFVYRQFVYDDGSLFYGTNLDDGLNGLRIKNMKQPTGAAFFLRQLTIEYLFTGSQGGDVFVIEDSKRRGRDNYFNHSQFVDGWTYFGRTIGTPFLTPQLEVKSSLPDYGVGIANNRVSAYHLGVSALLLNKIDLSTRLSISQNAGTYARPYVPIPQQFSGIVTASVPLNWLGGVAINGSVALDAGGLLPRSVGGYLGIRKTGLLGHKAVSSADEVR